MSITSQARLNRNSGVPSPEQSQLKSQIKFLKDVSNEVMKVFYVGEANLFQCLTICIMLLFLLYLIGVSLAAFFCLLSLFFLLPLSSFVQKDLLHLYSQMFGNKEQQLISSHFSSLLQAYLWLLSIHYIGSSPCLGNA